MNCKKNVVIIMAVLILCPPFAEAVPVFSTPAIDVSPFIEQYTSTMKISSSPNPIGSGARALGMGGAFIGVADDATSASWNPAGLVQLKKPEISFVASGFHRVEDNKFATNHEADGSQTVSGQNINYLSAVYPFTLFERNMVASINYQTLYDFSRKWSFPFATDGTDETGMMQYRIKDRLDYEQTGSLSALGIAYAIRVVPKISLGITINIWNDSINKGRWEETYHHDSLLTLEIPGILPPSDFPFNVRRKETREFDGINANIGALCRLTNRLNMGMVLKTPFTADISHQIKEENQPEIRQEEKLDMPLSFGVGISYRFSDRFTMSTDIYRTEWQDFILTDANGTETSPITGKSPKDSDIKPTYQVRIGGEYLFIDKIKEYIIPVRAGVFYDPAPAQGHPDDYYGFSTGTGLAKGIFVADIGYQYRFGNDTGSSITQFYENFSQDMDEHMLYFSMIVHF